MDRGVGRAERAHLGLGGDAVDGVRDDHRDDAMPYGVDTIRLRISFPAVPALQGYDDGIWRMRPLRGWTGGQAVDAEPSAGAEQGGDGAPDGAGWGGAGGSFAIPISDRISAASDEAATPGNPNAKVDALWAERAAVTAEMDRLNAGGDYGRAAAELYQRLENRRDIIDADLRSQFNGSLSGTGVQEPGDLEAWLREQAGQASGQPDAYDRMSAEDQRRFIRTHAPDYEIARADEMARRYGEAAGGLVGGAFRELGVGIPGAVGGAAGMVGRRGGNSAGASARNQLSRPAVPKVLGSDVKNLGTQVQGRFPTTPQMPNAVMYHADSNGTITSYQVWAADGFPAYRVDMMGASHGGVSTPYVTEFSRNVSPSGQVFVGKPSPPKAC